MKFYYFRVWVLMRDGRINRGLYPAENKRDAERQATMDIYRQGAVHLFSRQMDSDKLGRIR